MSGVPTRYDVTDPEERELGITAAVASVRRGELVVLPTDTVYGLAADAFSPEAVTRLLDAKGRGRDMPPPVLVSAVTTLEALAAAPPGWSRLLVDHYWPGPLTLVLKQQSSLSWDLGDTRGTVAVRMPDDEVALELLNRTGPLAVSSANQSGMAAATTADEAEDMLGHEVDVVLDGGPTRGDLPSTIIDATGENPRVLRVGAVPVEELRELLATHEIELEDVSDRA